ncbi:hypothetical protein TSAR_002527 [Trichomalopsis sarcophagae]|uniref:Uncharacterized protein n=1 Tax=Trichomalopsis sarcophagae TaxID=543379 RepID=A0A232FKP3_9HYME|nr:hypothetical protein TSAR_002527 [Trichomalopsis sarcophagae]
MPKREREKSAEQHTWPVCDEYLLEAPRERDPVCKGLAQALIKSSRRLKLRGNPSEIPEEENLMIDRYLKSLGLDNLGSFQSTFHQHIDIPAIVQYTHVDQRLSINGILGIQFQITTTLGLNVHDEHRVTGVVRYQGVEVTLRVAQRSEEVYLDISNTCAIIVRCLKESYVIGHAEIREWTLVSA